MIIIGVQLAAFGWYQTYSDFEPLGNSIHPGSTWAHVGVGYTHRFR
ncbi:MAG TPA: hypothetical protein VHI13_17755 [Candidatus Kapabacteria bacterium]|nr:hypothetical protein [Candidatus Kapabacteria bacterium]